MNNLNHNNIVKLRGIAYSYFTFKGNDTREIPKYILMDLYPNSLDKLLEYHIKHRIPIKLQDIFVYMDNLIDAVCYLHDKGFVHGNINPMNMLVTEDNECHLSYFGSTRIKNTLSQSM